MAYYSTCANCGAHLDPGEKCECIKNINAICDEVRERGMLKPVKASMVNY